MATIEKTTPGKQAQLDEVSNRVQHIFVEEKLDLNDAATVLTRLLAASGLQTGKGKEEFAAEIALVLSAFWDECAELNANVTKQ